MNKIYILFILSYILYACSNGEQNDASVLNASVESISFGVDGGKYTVNIECDEIWLIEGSSEWYSIDQKVGKGNASIIISVTPNNKTVERYAFFLLKSGSLSRKISISQSPIITGITISQSEIIYSRFAESKTFSIETKEEWYISQLPFWCTADINKGKGNQEIKITVTPNNSNSIRKGIVSISTKETVFKLEIVQSIADFIVEKGGTLRDILKDKDLLDNKTLILAGILNYDDFTILRNLKSLQVLDLECVRIEESETFNPYYNQVKFNPANSIPHMGLYQSSIVKIKLPNNLEIIGREAFENVYSLSKIEFPSPIYRIESGAFKNNYGLKKVIIPSNVKEMEDFIFLGCTGLKEVVIEEGISTIEYGTFRGCSDLESVVLPNSLKIIKDQAFSGCTWMKTIVLPESIEEIGYLAFAYNTWLSEIHIKSKNPPKLVDSPFWQISNECKLYIPKGSKQLYDRAEWNQFTIIEE